MAMIRCGECGNPVSNIAPTCPNCGAPVSRAAKKAARKGNKEIGCFGSIFIIVVVVIIAAKIVGGGSPATRNPGPGAGPGTGSASSAPAKPKTAEEIRQEKIERQFSAWDGAHLKLERSVEDSLKDPDSYEHIETRYGIKGDRLTVVMTFRAKNSFGGYVVQQAKGVYDIEGNTLEQPTLIE